MQDFLKKQCIDSLTIITYDALEVCGGVFIYRDSALCPYFLNYLLCSGRFWASTLGQWVCSQ